MRATEDPFGALRLKFETWANRRGLNLTRSHRDTNVYSFPATQAAWEASQYFSHIHVHQKEPHEQQEHDTP